jgi:hypothetical protein
MKLRLTPLNIVTSLLLVSIASSFHLPLMEVCYGK